MKDLPELMEKFEEKEHQLTKVYEDFPEDWFVYSDIKEVVESIISDIEQTEQYLEHTAWCKYEKKVDRQLNRFIRHLKKHIQTVETFLKRDKKSKRLSPEVMSRSMKNVIESLHILRFHMLGYPINAIRRKSIWKALLKGLRTQHYLLPDINYEEAKAMVRSLIHEQLIAIVQHESTERPYLVVTQNGTAVRLHIIKRKKTRDSLIISKLMKLLGMRRMTFDSKTRLVDENPEHINRIEFIKGKNVLGLPKFQSRFPAIACAYYLGAACADGFCTNLSDRPLNIYVQEGKFRYVLRQKNWPEFIGERNPVFNIDYEFFSEQDAEWYLHSQIFGTRGVMTLFLTSLVDFQSKSVELDEIMDSFHVGFFGELERIRNEYETRSQEVDDLLRTNNITYLKERLLFSQDIFREMSQKLKEELAQTALRLVA